MVYSTHIGIVANRTVPVRVTYKDIPLDITPETEVVRYLGFWATPNGNMQDVMQLVMDRTLRAKETIQGHPLGPKQVVEIFSAKAVGNFRYLATAPWKRRDLDRLDRYSNHSSHAARPCGQMYANERCRSSYHGKRPPEGDEGVVMYFQGGTH